ncbi:hypothetical protein RHGRI_004920 [Rhododendron griersonianum]|uniref:Uncharacterized protein n=1 Tax=Rhododendron griersonianum TaxID=479676 RepID=A0AAV6LCJ8_9ERIC|nr:hypothetical protein RHGRI_004920 [Rhododendron griersonianum]
MSENKRARIPYSQLPQEEKDRFNARRRALYAEKKLRKENMDGGLLGNRVLQHSSPSSTNWFLGGPDKYEDIVARLIGQCLSLIVHKKKEKFDHIVIETTGSDCLLDTLDFSSWRCANIHLDDVKPKGVVNEAAEQIAYADRITVNEQQPPPPVAPATTSGGHRRIPSSKTPPPIATLRDYQGQTRPEPGYPLSFSLFLYAPPSLRLVDLLGRHTDVFVVLLVCDGFLLFSVV